MDSARYGTPPAPPPLSAGSIPSQRLSTQMPQYNVGEAPACVQNAMMTKDKKPFTYTPGGIDLSQIKSQRMAKRLARNAQSEGATGQQQMNRPTPPPQQQYQQSNGGAPQAAASQLGATAMGMPFQVLPTGPPPPPPQPGRGGAAPPPPPPVPQNTLGPQSNGSTAQTRRSPTPQNFEPPPMGFRPEIKIPPNPMAALKKVPPPKEKNNFWVEEYRKERSKSPMVGNDENDYNRSPPNNPQPETNQYTYNNYNNTNTSQPQQNQYRSPSPQPMRQQQEYQTQRASSPPRTPLQQQVEQPRRVESPYQAQYSPQAQFSPQQQSPAIQRQLSQHQPQYQAAQNSPQQQQSPPIQRQQTAPPTPQQYPSPTLPQYQQQQQKQQQQQQISPTQQQSVPWRSQRPAATAIQNNVSRPRDVMSPAPSESPRPQPQQQQQNPGAAYLRSRDVLSPAQELQAPQMSQPYQQKNAQVGSIYIPPVVTQAQQQSAPQQQLSSRQVPANRWVSAQQPSADSQTLNRVKSPPPPSSNGFGSSSNNTGLRLQINNNTSNSTVKERIIPIQLEQTPTRTPSTPGFGPQPYYNAGQQQYSSVPSPPLQQGSPNNGQNSPSYIVRSPNQFVDQGYNNYPGSQDPNRVTSPTMQQMQPPRLVQQANNVGGVKTRVIPIAMDLQSDGPLNPNNVRGPISQQPLVIQNDPRNQNSWGNGSATPNQSKSFRILQKITDTADGSALESKAVESDGGDQEPQLQRPTYARQMAPGQVNSPTIDQMKRMQLNNEQAFANRAKNQGTSPVMKQPQPNRYVNQRPVYSPEEQSQQYVHPSEQQVPEPKKYTGSAIPSRSFKILQAMTTPENAAEMEGSDVVETNKSITECPYQQPTPPHPYAYPYPYLPPCCLPPPPPTLSQSSSNGDGQNWPYPLPHHHHHPHPHHHHHPHPHPHPHPHQHHPYPPCPCYYYYPPNDYDSQTCSQYQARDSLRRSHSKSQDLPNIIITPSADDIPQISRKLDLGRDQREGSVIETLSRRLSEISKPIDVDLNMSQDDDKNYLGDSGKEFDNNSPSPIKSECENSKIASESESSDDLLTSSTDSTSSLEDCAKQLPNGALQTIKSVTNIQVYNKNALSPIDAIEDDRTVDEGESMIFDEEDEEEEDIVGEELEYDEEVEDMLIEEIDSEDEEQIEDLDEDEEVIIMDDLSVIYEENEADLVSPRPTSRVSSSVSGSTTLANDECDEEKEAVIKEDEDEDNSNSVTVRLPLKLSFSRSSNDENIATVEVGNSQIEDKRRSFSIASLEADPEEYESDCDVSVTISLSPSSGSVDRMSSLSPVPRKVGDIVKEKVREEDDSEAEDVSVSFSLAMRNKFMDQTWGGDVTNNIAEKKKKKKKKEQADSVEAWRRNSSEFKEGSETRETKKIKIVEDTHDTIALANKIKDLKKVEELKKIEEIRKAEKKQNLEEMKRAAEVKQAEDIKKAEEKKKIEEIKKAEETKKAQELKKAEENKKLEEIKRFEETKKGQELKKAEENKKLEEIKRSEETKKGQELKKAEENKKLEEIQRSEETKKSQEVKKAAELKKAEEMKKSETKQKAEQRKKDEDMNKIDEIKKPEEVTQSLNNAEDELDFWATLQATRKEAQLFLEKTASYWGKKIDGRQQSEDKPTTETIETAMPKEPETDDDFWTNIRVKDTVEQVKEDIPEKQEPKVKSTKPKKKKKIIIAAPEKEPEPEHTWSTINLPNAKNRSKIVESTIKMIQGNTKKPAKKLVRMASNEIEIGEFISSIRKSFDEDVQGEDCEDEVAVVTEPLKTATKKSAKTEKHEEQVASVLTPKMSESIRSKLVREKAELKTQILSQKFAQAFVVPEKPAILKAVLSEAPILKVETITTVNEVKIIIDESEKLEKPKKKTTKTKKVQEAEDGTLKPPKTVMKSAKEPKKTKKKKLETEVVDKTGLDEVNQTVATKSSSSAVEEEVHKVEKQAKDTDFWAEIESVKTSETAEVKTQATERHQEIDFWAIIESPKDVVEESCKTGTQETDFWAEIECSKPKEPVNPTEETDVWIENDYSNVKVEVLTNDVDIWSEDESSKVKNDGTYSNNKTDPIVEIQIEVNTEEADICAKDGSAEAKPQNVEVDFWADITSSSHNKKSSTYSWSKYDSLDAKHEAEAQVNSQAEPSNATHSFETENEERPLENVVWSDVKASNVKSSTYSWNKFDSLEPKKEEIIEVESPNVDIWAEYSDNNKGTLSTNNIDSPKADEEVDFWAEIDSSKTKNAIEIKTEVKDADSWPQINSIKAKWETQSEETVTAKKNAALQEITSKAESELATQVPNFQLYKEPQPVIVHSPSITKDEPAEIDFWAKIETSKSKTSKKNVQTSRLQIYGSYDVELINLEPVPTYYAVYTEPVPPMDFWATVSYVTENTAPQTNVSDERETDFWASNSSGNETEVNSEVDMEKIDFWVTQRKFQANGDFVKDLTPKKEEEPEEIDFWAEIKGENDCVDEVPVVNQKEECEVRRNNYKKAMAFFTNTVNVDKKEQSPENENQKTSEPLERQAHNSWTWRSSMENEWEAPEDREVNNVFLLVEDNETEEETDTLIENNPYEMEEGCAFEMIEEEQCEEEQEDDSSESISDSTPNHFQIEHQYPKPEPAPIKPKESSVEPSKFADEIKISVKDRIFAFETGTVEPPASKPKSTSLIVDSVTPKSNLSRNSSQRSESEIEEDDSGVTDMNKPLSETDTECESFPELRKMTRYQRASTHSRLFKLLQDDGDVIEEEPSEKPLEDEFKFKPSRKKVVHNVSITRKQNPKAIQDAESMTQRRERLSLPLRKNSSIDAENPSTPNSPASPIFGQPSQPVSDKLVNELVQSLLLKKSSSTLKNLPMEKLQAAAKRVLEEELDSLENTSLDSTPALTPQEFKSESYSDYYDSWSAKTDSDTSINGSFEILPSKAFKALQETTATAKRRPWSVRCPRVLSSKTVNRDLARVTESPEIYSRCSNSPEVSFGSERASSVGRWRKF